MLVANNAAALRQAALSGLGIALLPELCVADQLGSARLILVLPDYAPTAPDIYAVFQPRSHTAPRVRKFVEFVAARLGTKRAAACATVHSDRRSTPIL